MLEAIEYTAIILAPVFIGSVVYLIITMVCSYYMNPYRVFKRKGRKVFKKSI